MINGGLTDAHLQQQRHQLQHHTLVHSLNFRQFLLQLLCRAVRVEVCHCCCLKQLLLLAACAHSEQQPAAKPCSRRLRCCGRAGSSTKQVPMQTGVGRATDCGVLADAAGGAADVTTKAALSACAGSTA